MTVWFLFVTYFHNIKKTDLSMTIVRNRNQSLINCSKMMHDFEWYWCLYLGAIQNGSNFFFLVSVSVHSKWNHPSLGSTTDGSQFHQPTCCWLSLHRWQNNPPGSFKGKLWCLLSIRMPMIRCTTEKKPLVTLRTNLGQFLHEFSNVQSKFPSWLK